MMKQHLLAALLGGVLLLLAGCTGPETPRSTATPGTESRTSEEEPASTTTTATEDGLPSNTDRASNSGSNEAGGLERDQENMEQSEAPAAVKEIEDEAVTINVVPGAKPEFQNPAGAEERAKYAKAAAPAPNTKQINVGQVSNAEVELIREDDSSN